MPWTKHFPLALIYYYFHQKKYFKNPKENYIFGITYLSS